MDSHDYYEVEDMLMTEDQFKKYCYPDENDLLVRGRESLINDYHAANDFNKDFLKDFFTKFVIR